MTALHIKSKPANVLSTNPKTYCVHTVVSSQDLKSACWLDIILMAEHYNDSDRLSAVIRTESQCTKTNISPPASATFALINSDS